MNIIPLILIALSVYFAIGVVFAAVFVCIGVSRIDHAAKGAPIGFRLLILPGSAALWPLLARRWAMSTQAQQWPREQSESIARLRRFHARLWLILGPALLFAMIAFIALRPGAPS